MKSIVANIVPIQSGTGTPSPSNPRPITGFSSVSVEQRGKNLVNVAGRTITSQTTVLSGVNFKKGTYIASADVKNNGSIRGNIRVAKTGTSTILAEIQCSEGDDARKSSSSFTLSEDMQLSILCNGASVGYSFSFDNLMIEIGSTATTYEPYNAETYTIDLGQEIMGGTADVVGGTGEETWGVIDLSNVQWSITTNRAIITELRGIIKPPLNNNVPSEAIAEKYSVIAWAESLNDHQTSYGVASDGTVVFYYDGTTPTGLFVYPLATPTEYTFTGQPINSYLGTNNVWTDSGEVLDVEYRADIDLLIAELET